MWWRVFKVCSQTFYLSDRHYFQGKGCQCKNDTDARTLYIIYYICPPDVSRELRPWEKQDSNNVNNAEFLLTYQSADLRSARVCTEHWPKSFPPRHQGLIPKSQTPWLWRRDLTELKHHTGEKIIVWSDCESRPENENPQSFLFERALIIIIFGNKRMFGGIIKESKSPAKLAFA